MSPLASKISSCMCFPETRNSSLPVIIVSTCDRFSGTCTADLSDSFSLQFATVDFFYHWLASPDRSLYCGSEFVLPGNYYWMLRVGLEEPPFPFTDPSASLPQPAIIISSRLLLAVPLSLSLVLLTPWGSPHSAVVARDGGLEGESCCHFGREPCHVRSPKRGEREAREGKGEAEQGRTAKSVQSQLVAQEWG